MVEFDRSAFIGKFQEEAGEYLQRLNEGVITLESDPHDRSLIDQMLRDAHTLKGSSRMVGLIEISDIAHRLEDIMVKVRDGLMEYRPEMSDGFFEALDAIVFLTDNAGKDVSGQIDVPALIAKLAAVAAGGEAPAGQPVVASQPAEDAATAAAQPAGDAAAPVAAATAQPAVPAEPSAKPAEDATEDEDAGEDETAAAGVQRAQRDDKLHSKVQNTIRIHTTQVDHLLNLVSEVVIGQIKAEQRVKAMHAAQLLTDDVDRQWTGLRKRLGDGFEAAEEADLLGDQLAELAGAVSALARDYVDDVSRESTVVADLQEQAMTLRMMPVSTIFNTFPRAMRDLAHQYGKDIEFQIEGGDTELDKKVLEEINDPLIHILRNAVDHGIERKEDRIAAGKPATGKVILAARQEGDHIVIEITDDGAGVDPAKVRASAIKKGYLTPAEAKAMSDREATYLIFEAGFSTSAIITEISGRGVGMDVVREFVVEKLKGSLDVLTEVGKYTTFRLTIPLTLAVIRALLLKAGDQVFAMPTTSVEETLRVAPEEIIKVEGRQVIRRQRRTVPLVHLHDVLGVEAARAPEGGKIPIITVGFSGHRIGFIVDALLGEQQMVIKTLGSHLRRVENVAGVTVLGAGLVVPILSVPDLMHNARELSGMRARKAAEPRREKERGPRRILICEDSFTTRELERSIFEAAGYVVETATDGSLGLGKLREGLQVDAVVTDVQMPNMTGFELTRAIKGDKLLKRIPVVIVTSLEREEEKAEGIDSGADAYITKSVFNQDTLIDTVERLIR